VSKREETDEKAMLAASLARQKMTREEIALYLGVGDRQVRRLLARSRQFYKFLARNIDAEMHLGETLMVFLEMEGRALKNLAEVKADSPVAVGWARAALDARKEIIKLLQECGAVLKVPETIEVGLPFDDPEIRKEYLALRARAREKAREKSKEERTLYCLPGPDQI
jgi:predicted transcriptional regulator